MTRTIIILALTITGLLAIPGAALAAGFDTGLAAPAPDGQIWALLIAGFGMTVLGLRRSGRTLPSA